MSGRKITNVDRMSVFMDRVWARHLGLRMSQMGYGSILISAVGLSWVRDAH
jgi:hypothetical protein